MTFPAPTKINLVPEGFAYEVAMRGCDVPRLDWAPALLTRRGMGTTMGN